MFEWLLMQDIYGKDLFPTIGNENDILKFCPKRKLNIKALSIRILQNETITYLSPLVIGLALFGVTSRTRLHVQLDFNMNVVLTSKSPSSS